MATFLGMLGTGDWADWDSALRPKHWRNTLFRLEPNGDFPLLGITSMGKSSSVDDPEFYWWTKGIPDHRATITGTYSDSLALLETAYVSGGVAGTELYVKMSAADAAKFREGHHVLFRYSDDFRLDCAGYVVAKTANAVAITLIETDNNGVGHDISDADILQIIGNVNAEGAPIPEAIAYAPTKIYNLTQIWRDPVDITRTAAKTRIRTGSGKSYDEQKRDALFDHGMAMERALIYGKRYEGVGANGKPLRTTRGLIDTIITYASNNVSSFETDDDDAYAGKTWLQAGEEWLNDMLEIIFRYGSQEKLAICGSGTLRGIQRLVMQSGNMQITPMTKAYGLKVVEWFTPFGTISLKMHPLFNLDPINRYSAVIIEPKDIEFRYIDDTFFKKDDSERKAGQIGIDGTKEEWLTEGGWEFHFPEAWAYLHGFNQDNTNI